MGTARRCYPGTHFLFYRTKQNITGGIFRNQRAGLPQHTVFAGLWAGGEALSEMRGNTLPYGGWGKGKRLLPCLPEGFVMINAQEIYHVLGTAPGL